MDKREYRIERLKLDAQAQHQAIEALKELAQNPLVEFAAGITFITWLCRGKQSFLEKATGIDLKQGGLGAGLVTIISAQQLSKSLPYITETVKDLAPIGGLLK